MPIHSCTGGTRVYYDLLPPTDQADVTQFDEEK